MNPICILCGSKFEPDKATQLNLCVTCTAMMAKPMTFKGRYK